MFVARLNDPPRRRRFVAETAFKSNVIQLRTFKIEIALQRGSLIRAALYVGGMPLSNHRRGA